MPHLTSEDEINIYQDLVRKEVEKFRNSQKKKKTLLQLF